MTKQRRPLTGSEAAGDGALLLAVNATLAAAGAGSGAIAGAMVPLPLVGFFIGLLLGIAGVVKRVRQLT